ncbi:helix-turn-helix domain-containing protein [Dactylosporangium sucinum]|uniref:helix-turn-helix domain-containing protein n=1 Tax=Dactylosporangium sucinum TaxID=1424081 RepID=UPI00227A7649|nr:helix-turn-helix transcriptional regulator [Dactylosporangium sucinum]
MPRRSIGRTLKELRQQAGMSVEAALRNLEWSKAKLYRVEAGLSPVRRIDVIAMCGMYGALPEITEALAELSAETKAKGWWHSYTDNLPDWFELYVGLEAAASRVRHYEPGLIPGLLQTAAYASAIIATGPDITPEDIDRRVALRLARQAILIRTAPRAPALEVIVEEAALRRPLADRPAMVEQLDRLITANQAPNVSVKIVPSSVGPHRALVAGAFVILDFPAVGAHAPEPTTIYSESLTGALYLDKPDEVATYETAWKTLNKLCLDRTDSAALLATIQKEHDVRPD